MRRIAFSQFEIGVVLLILLLLWVMLAPPRQQIRRGRRSDSMNHLRQLVLAMHNYSDSYGHFPPAHIADENGKPMRDCQP